MTRLADSNLLVELIDIEPIDETWNVYPDIVETKTAILHLFQCGLPAPALIDHPVKELTVSKAKWITVDAKTVAEDLRVPKFSYVVVEVHDQLGVVTELAWT